MINLESILEKSIMKKEDLVYLLTLTDKGDIDKLFNKAYEIKNKYVGKKVYFRGLVELSNICTKDCYYCGIRKSNKNVNRFIMSKQEVVECAKWCYEHNYGSIVIQSGERDDDVFVDYIEDLLKEVKAVSNNKLGITISMGEQTLETYKRWFNAGAHRYLLRIESSNSEIYRSLHPFDHDFDKRKKALFFLKEAGYQVGTGVMIGLPNQIYSDLADDIIFFKQNDIDMIGMGPFIPHLETPMKNSMGSFESIKEKQLLKSLKMIAVTRIFLKDVNIASTTALQALNEEGREKGLLAGANILMPNITDIKYRKGYQLYSNKPNIDENDNSFRYNLEDNIKKIGEDVGYNVWGDSPHFLIKNKK